jgi:DNA-binding response OmpR family regulator
VLLRPDSAVPPAAPLVFLADDDDLLRLVVKEALLDQGYQVNDVGDGATALEMLAMAADGIGAVPDVVILDVRMPGYSGLGVLKMTRRFARQPATLLLTALPDPSIDILARGFGAHGVLRKPVDLAILIGAVHDARLARNASHRR